MFGDKMIKRRRGNGFEKEKENQTIPQVIKKEEPVIKETKKKGK